jgi:hypothetical protein
MIILTEKKIDKSLIYEAVVKYPNPPEQLIKIATTAAKAFSGRKRLSKLGKSDLAEAIQLICGIATVFPNNKTLDFNTLYRAWMAGKFDAAWSNPDIYHESEARSLAFIIIDEYAKTLANLGF